MPLESLSASCPEGPLTEHSSCSTSSTAFKLFLSLWPGNPCAQSPPAAQAPFVSSLSTVFLGNVPRTPQSCWNLATWQGSCRYRQRQTNLWSASLAMAKAKGLDAGSVSHALLARGCKHKGVQSCTEQWPIILNGALLNLRVFKAQETVVI